MALSAVVDLTLSAESEVSFAVLIADTSYTKLFSLNQTSVMAISAPVDLILSAESAVSIAVLRKGKHAGLLVVERV